MRRLGKRIVYGIRTIGGILVEDASAITIFIIESKMNLKCYSYIYVEK